MSANDERVLTCVDCGQRFTLTAEDQAFFREKGYDQPKRCKPCRQAKKARNAERDAQNGGVR